MVATKFSFFGVWTSDRGDFPRIIMIALFLFFVFCFFFALAVLIYISSSVFPSGILVWPNYLKLFTCSKILIGIIILFSVFSFISNNKMQICSFDFHSGREIAKYMINNWQINMFHRYRNKINVGLFEIFKHQKLKK